MPGRGVPLDHDLPAISDLGRGIQRFAGWVRLKRPLRWSAGWSRPVSAQECQCLGLARLLAKRCVVGWVGGRREGQLYIHTMDVM